MAIKREGTCLKDVYDLYDEAHLYARNVVHTYILYTMEEIKWKKSQSHVWWSIFVFKAYTQLLNHYVVGSNIMLNVSISLLFYV